MTDLTFIEVKEVHYAKDITKRELFAAMAMQGFLSNEANGSEDCPQIAQWSVMQADALIAELSK